MNVDDYEDEEEMGDDVSRIENGSDNDSFVENEDGDGDDAEAGDEAHGGDGDERGYDAGREDVQSDDENDAGDENGDTTAELETSKEDDGDEAEEGFEEAMGGGGPIFDEDEDEDVQVVGRKRRALDAQYDPVAIRKRTLRRYYERGSFFSFPTSALLVNLIKIKGVSVTSDLMWQAILGTTDQFLKANITEDLYNSICDAIKSEISNLQGENKYRILNNEGAEISVQASENGRVEDTMDYRFFLYRHWSLYDSMYFSPYVASKLSTWRAQGGAKLQEMLAKIGLPLQECKQHYQFMTPHFRQKFRTLTHDGTIADEYDLKNPGILYHSFSRYTSFKNPVAASDVVHAATALIEICKHEVTGSEGEDGNQSVLQSQMRSFNKAYDTLGIRNEELLREGIQAAIGIQRAVVRQAAIMLERADAIIKARKFRYSFIYKTTSGGGIASNIPSAIEGDIESPFTRPMVLTRLGQFLMLINKENRKW